MTVTKLHACSFKSIFCSAAVLILIGFASTTVAQESRNWVDSSGQFKIEATFEKVEGEKVLLKLPNGEFKQISLSMLSTTDQKYVQDLRAPVPGQNLPGDGPTDPLVQPLNGPPSSVPASEPPADDSEPSADSLIQSTIEMAGEMEKVSDQPAPVTTQPAVAAVQPTAAEAKANVADDISIADIFLTEEDLQPPSPLIHIGQTIGDLDIGAIALPTRSSGPRVNPKYLLPVEREDLALLPSVFQGAALRLLNEPTQPREAILALEYLKVHWPKDRQPSLIKLVINCASSDFKYIREAALEILSDRDPDQSFPYIFARVDDTSFTIRSQAYQMLRKVGDRRAIEPLAKRFSTGEVDRIASLLRSFGADAESAVAPYLAHEDPEIRLRACNLIGKIGTMKSLSALEQMKEREETMVLQAQTRSSIKKIKRRNAAQSR